jgi:hypothetical protein
MTRAIRWGFLSISLAASSLAAAADSGGLAGPVAGFFFDRAAGAVRPIEGLPGAARLGAPLPLPFGVSLAVTASRRDYALAVPESGGAPVLVRGLRAEAPEVVELPGVLRPSSLAIAASGDVAVLYSAAERRVQFIQGLPAAPRALDPLDAGDLDSVTAIALDASGAAALLAAADGRIYRVRAGADPVSIARLPGVSALSFVPGRDAALAAAAGSGEILLLDSLGGALSIRSIASPLAGVASLRAVRALEPAAAAVITADGRLAVIDFESGSLEWIPLAGEAEDFDPIDRSLFVLNRAGVAPLLLLDAAQGRSAWFVPPVRPAARPRGHGKNLTRGEDRPR